MKQLHYKLHWIFGLGLTVFLTVGSNAFSSDYHFDEETMKCVDSDGNEGRNPYRETIMRNCTDYRGKVFKEKDLTNADFRGSCLHETMFIDSKLNGAKFQGSDSSEDCDHGPHGEWTIRHSQLEGASLSCSWLPTVIVSDSIFKYADFRGVRADEFAIVVLLCPNGNCSKSITNFSNAKFEASKVLWGPMGLKSENGEEEIINLDSAKTVLNFFSWAFEQARYDSQTDFAILFEHDSKDFPNPFDLSGLSLKGDKIKEVFKRMEKRPDTDLKCPNFGEGKRKKETISRRTDDEDEGGFECLLQSSCDEYKTSFLNRFVDFELEKDMASCGRNAKKKGYCGCCMELGYSDISHASHVPCLAILCNEK